MPGAASEYRRDYPLRLPMPLAELYRNAFHANSPRARHDNAFYLFEALIKLLAALPVAAYLRDIELGRPRNPAIDRALATLALPSMGQWVSMLRALARHYGQIPEAASHPLGGLWRQLDAGRNDAPALCALFNRIKNGPDGQPGSDLACSILQVFEALVQYRNGVFGHGGPRLESFFENEMGPLLPPALNELLAPGALDIVGPRASRLVYISQIRVVDSATVEADLRELINTRSERLPALRLPSAAAAGLAPNVVAVLWPGWESPLRLDPLLSFREAELSDEMLFLNRGRNGRDVECLSYTTGRTERNAALAPSLAALLQRIVGAPVTVDTLKALAEQSISETPSVEALFPDQPPPERIYGDYQLIAEIGRGGMGVVYLARQLSLGRLVALKMLPADIAGDEVVLSRFRREIRLLTLCDHPNIIKILFSGKMPDGQLFYTMEYVPGCDFEHLWRELSSAAGAAASSSLGNTTFSRAVAQAARKKRDETLKKSRHHAPADPSPIQGPPPFEAPEADASQAGVGSPPGRQLPAPADPPELLKSLPPFPTDDDEPGGYARHVATLIRDVAGALDAMHQRNLVHRDIKPANLMLTPDGSRAVLMDFGLAKSANSLGGVSLMREGLLGTLRYCAPEQLAAASAEISPRTDIRGLGVVLWELLTRRRLFADAEDEKQLSAKVAQVDVPRLRSVDPAFDPDLEAIVARATERRPEDRIPSARLLAECLQLWLDGKPVPVRTPSMGEITRRWVREHRALVASALVSLAVIVATVATAFALINTARKDAVGLAKEKSTLADQKTGLANDLKKQASSADFDVATLLADKGDHDGALAHLARALRTDPANLDAQALSLSLLLHHNCPPIWEAVHEAGVNSAAFSPDGTRILTASWDKTARLWDARTGAPLGQPMKHDSFVLSAAFSPDGARIVTASVDKTARLWDARTGAPLGQPMKHDDSVITAAFSPDGTRILTASWDKTARLWDARTGASIGQPMKHDESVSTAAFSPDGARIVTASDDKTARLWDSRTGAPIGQPMKHDESVSTAAFSPNGARIVTTSLDNTARLWDVRTGAPLGQPMKHDSFVNSAAFSPDGTRIVTASGDAARLWDGRTGAPLGQPMQHDGPVASAVFSPDGARIVTASDDNTARLWDARTGGPLGQPMKHDSRVFSAAFSPDGARIVTASDDHTARLWDVRTGAPIGQPMKHDESVSTAAFSPNGARIVTASSDHTARLWDARTGAPLGQPMQHDKSLNSAAFSPDGARIVTASWDDTARIWDGRTGAPIGQPMKHDDSVRTAAFSPDGARIVTASDDNTARLWDVRTGAPLGQPMKHDSFVLSAAFSPDGARIVTASWDDTARIWDGRTGAPIGQPMKHDSFVNSAAFSPDGTRIVTASLDKTARLWDARTGAPLGQPMQHDGYVNSAAFSPDGTRIVTASSDKTARLWDARTGAPVGQPMKHDDTVDFVAFSPDGTRIVTASSDKTARLWDARTGAPLGAPLKHNQPVGSAAFSPDGTRIVTASEDHTARLWDVGLGARTAPSWLAAMDELYAAHRMNGENALQPLLDVPVLRAALETEVALLPAGRADTRWAKWLLTSPLDRTVSPLSDLTRAKWMAEALQENSEASLRAVLQLEPANAIACARLSLICASSPDKMKSSSAEALLSFAESAAPHDAEVQWRRVVLLKMQGKDDEAMAHAKGVPDFSPAQQSDLWPWEAKASACARIGRADEALTAITKAIDLATPLATSPLALVTDRHSLARCLIERARIYLTAHQEEQAKSDVKAVKLINAEFVPDDLKRLVEN